MAMDQLAIALCFLQWIQVLALDVLDQSELGGRRLVHLTDDRRDAVDSRALGRAPTPLASDDEEILTRGPKQDRLQHAALTDRLGELVERLLVELHSRLVRIGLDPCNVDLADTAARCRRIS